MTNQQNCQSSGSVHLNWKHVQHFGIPHLETLVFDEFFDAIHDKEAATVINVDQVSCT